jgi:hypothetical protein
MRPTTLAGLLLLAIAVPAAAQTGLCESIDGYRECRLGFDGKAQLVTELSENRCFEGVSWGTQSAGVVWVDRGCRARFSVGIGNGSTLGAKRLVCESAKGERQVCPATEATEGVSLARQLSKAPCVEGDSWAYDLERGAVWVDHGCRAEFSFARRSGPVQPAVVLDAPVNCESLNGRRTECPADTLAGVQIVRQLGDAPCAYGRGWGFDVKSIWVNKGCRAEFVVRGKPKPLARAVVCESQDKQRNRCAAETRFGVALVRQISEQACALGHTWDFDADGVWVSDGCRAQFALGGFRLPQDAVPASASRLVCESKDGSKNLCAASAAHGVGLVRQIGEADCILNRTWGYGPDGVWVSGNCRAEFAVAH